MMRNLFQLFADLMPEPPLETGTVTAATATGFAVNLTGGGTVQARGSATVGSFVYVRDGLIEGLAPVLSLSTFDI